jgi:hypothetical protein
LEITKTGELKWKMQKTTLTVEGDLLATIKGMLTVDATGALTLTSKAAATLQGASAALIGGAVQMAVGGAGAGISGTSPSKPFKLSEDAQFPIMRWSPDMMAFFTTVIAALGGPVAGVPAMRVGPALIPPSLHINQKVKA